MKLCSRQSSRRPVSRRTFSSWIRLLKLPERGTRMLLQTGMLMYQDLHLLLQLLGGVSISDYYLKQRHPYRLTLLARAYTP